MTGTTNTAGMAPSLTFARKTLIECCLGSLASSLSYRDAQRRTVGA